MKITELRELLPDFEPNPPLHHMPPQERNRLSETMGQVGDGSVRWCACRVFMVYLNPNGKFKQPVQPGSPVKAFPLFPCDAVTRGYFHKNHHKVITAALAKAEGFGHTCCFTFDRTPVQPFELARTYGLSVRPAHITLANNTRNSLERRGLWFASLKDLPEKSAATAQADRIARML